MAFNVFYNYIVFTVSNPWRYQKVHFHDILAIFERFARFAITFHTHCTTRTPVQMEI